MSCCSYTAVAQPPVVVRHPDMSWQTPEHLEPQGLIARIAQVVSQCLQRVAGWIIMPAQWIRPERMLRGAGPQWQFNAQPVQINVNGMLIDAVCIKNRNASASTRWVLHSNGNSYLHQEIANENSIFRLCQETNAHLLLFDYPGCGFSTGWTIKTNMVDTYRAMLSYLETKECGGGVGATEIIGYGFSIGGGVQGEALREHTLQDGIKYVFVQDRTFSDLSAAAEGIGGILGKAAAAEGIGRGGILGKIMGLLVHCFQWNLSSVESARRLGQSVLVLQTSDTRQREILDDGVITSQASLASALRSDANTANTPQYLPIWDRHNEALSEQSWKAVATWINQRFTARSSQQDASLIKGIA